MKKISISILFLLIIILGFYLYSSNSSETPKEINISEEKNNEIPQENNLNIESARIIETSMSSMSFVLPDGWEIIKKTDKQILIKSQKQDQPAYTKNDLITINYFIGDKFESMYGPEAMTLYFNDLENCWYIESFNIEKKKIGYCIVENSDSEIDGKPNITSPQIYPSSVIAINKDEFIELDLSGGGYAEDFNNLKSSIRFK